MRSQANVTVLARIYGMDIVGLVKNASSVRFKLQQRESVPHASSVHFLRKMKKMKHNAKINKEWKYDLMGRKTTSYP